VKVNIPDGGSGPGHCDYTYSSDHRLLTTKDPNGHFARTSTYDTLDTWRRTPTPSENVTSYAYDFPATQDDDHESRPRHGPADLRRARAPAKEVDPLGERPSTPTTPIENELTRKNALNEVSTFTYDSNGNQTSIANARGEATHITYNGFSQPLTSTIPLAIRRRSPTMLPVLQRHLAIRLEPSLLSRLRTEACR
jgi:YD repeat-containing protein